MKKKKKKKRPILNRRVPKAIAKRKFTRLNKKIIYDAIKIGLPRLRSAELAGVDPVTWTTWMNRGKERPDSPYGYFREKCFALKVEREKEALDIIHKCGNGKFTKTDTTVKKNANGEIEVTKKTSQMYPQWQAEAWYLERRRAKEYALNKEVTNKTPEEHAKEINDAYNAIIGSIPNEPKPWCNQNIDTDEEE